MNDSMVSLIDKNSFQSFFFKERNPQKVHVLSW